MTVIRGGWGTVVTFGILDDRGQTRSVPHSPTGMTGAPVIAASFASTVCSTRSAAASRDQAAFRMCSCTGRAAQNSTGMTGSPIWVGVDVDCPCPPPSSAGVVEVRSAVHLWCSRDTSSAMCWAFLYRSAGP